MAANTEALKAAADVVAAVFRTVAAVKSDETAAAVNIADHGRSMWVNGGRRGGRWGWVPIEAWMFDDDGKHPLFGDRSHWYRQGSYPMTSITVAASIDDAAQAYADVRIPQLIDEYLK